MAKLLKAISWKRVGIIGAALISILLLLGTTAVIYANSENGKTRIVKIVNEALASEQSTIHISEIKGSVFSDFQIPLVQLSDQSGPWLELRQINMQWLPSSVLNGKISVATLNIETIEFLRAPEAEVETENNNDPFTLPSLPIDIEVAQYNVENLIISDALTEVAAEFNIKGSLKLTENDGIIINSNLVNTAGQGDEIQLDISLPNDAADLKADLIIAAPKGGFFNSLSQSLPNEDMSLKFMGCGPLNNWSATIEAALSEQNFAEGLVKHSDDEWSLHADLDVRQFVDTSIVDLVGENNSIDIKYSNANLEASLISNIAQLNVKGIEKYDFSIDIINPEPINQMISPTYLRATKINGNLDHLNNIPQLTVNFNDMVLGVEDTIETTVHGQFIAALDDQVINATSMGHIKDIKGTAVESIPQLLQEGVSWNLDANLDQATSISEIKKLSIINENFQINSSGTVNIYTGAINADVNSIIESLSNVVNDLELEQNLSGELKLNTKVVSEGSNFPVDVTLSMNGNNIDFDSPFLNELIGISPTFNAQVSRSAEGAIMISNTVLDGAFFDLKAYTDIEANQNIQNANFDLSFSNIENMKSLDGAKLTGDIDIVGNLSGNLNSPSLLIKTGFNALTIQSIELQNLKAELNAENIINELKGGFYLTGESNYGALNFNSDFIQNGETFTIPSLNIAIGPYEAIGAFDIPAGKPVIGEIDISTQEIEETEKYINGSITAKLKLLEENAAQKIELDSEVSEFFLVLNQNDLLTLAAASISGQALITGEEPSLSLNAKFSELMHPAFQSSEILLNVNQEENGYNYNIGLSGTEEMPYAFDVSGAVMNHKEGEQLISLALSGLIDETPVSLAQNAEIAVKANTLNVAPFDLLFGEGNITGHLDIQQNNIQAKVSMNEADIKPLLVFIPDLPLTGMLNGNFEVSSDTASLLSNFNYSLTEIELKKQNTFLDYEAEITAIGTITEKKSELSGSINFNNYFVANYSAILPVNIALETFDVKLPEDQNIQGQINWNGYIAPVWPMLQLIDHNLKGDLSADIILSGTYENPDIDGTINMTEGRYENMQTGFVADAIDMSATIKDRQFSLDRFNANDGEEGIIKASADIKIDPNFNYTAQADLMIESAKLVRQPELQVTASSELNFQKSTDKTSLSGEITVENANIGAVDQASVSIAELDVTEINSEGTLQALNKQEDALGPIELDLNLIVPNQLFVMSYGLDSEWEADLKIAGTSEVPIVGGTANLIRGFFEFSDKRFELKRGNFSFPNDKSNDPIIEIAAEHAMREMTANLRIFGRASNPKLELSSTPYLPENEVLARILFGTSVAELTAVEAVQLASAVYSLSNGGGQGMLGGIRRAIGVDRLSIDNDNGREYGTTITGGKYLTNNVYVEVSTAPATGETATSVEIDLTRNLSLVTRRTMDNDNNLSIRWFWDY